MRGAFACSGQSASGEQLRTLVSAWPITLSIDSRAFPAAPDLSIGKVISTGLVRIL
jgi:hypothetical protein